MRELMLVRTVIIHGPDFFVTGAVTDKVDLSLRDSLESTSQPQDDLVSELVRHDPSCCVGGIVGVLLVQEFGPTAYS